MGAKHSHVFKTVFIIGCFSVLTACATFPELDAQVDPAIMQADFPAFLTTTEMQQIGDFDGARPVVNVTSRIARLRARAQALRGSILSSADRARLSQNIR